VLSTLQTKYNTKKIVVTNQAGVARKFFDCKRVEEINEQIDLDLKGKGIKIDDWQYCPDIDSKYASLHPEFDLDKRFVKDVTKRKPSTTMVLDSLRELGKGIENFSNIIVLGDREEDETLSKNLNAKFIDVKGKKYDDILSEAKKILGE
jgi:histidinol phosphatase-like enzyme